jgi:membrane protein implicated in regulation of membrane protease activity
VVLYLYLFSAVAGSLLVGVSMFTGGSANDSDGDHGGEDGGDDGADEALTSHHGAAALAAGDGQGAAADGHDAQLAPAAGTAGGHSHGPAAAGHHGGHSSWAEGASALALFLFSLQLWTYVLAFGGITGLLLRMVAHVAEPMAGLCALGVGLGTAITARRVLRQLSAGSDSGTVDGNRLVGSTAQVLVPAPVGGTGKVRLAARGQTVDLLARSSDGQPLLEGGEVLILDLKDGVAEVTSDLDDRPRALPQAGAQGKNPAALADHRSETNPPQKG